MAAPVSIEADAPTTDTPTRDDLLLRMTLLPNSAEQKTKLVVEHLAATMVWVTLEYPPLEFRRGCRLVQGILCKIKVIDHFVIERLAAGRAVSWKYSVIRKISILLECCAPTLEMALA